MDEEMKALGKNKTTGWKGNFWDPNGDVLSNTKQMVLWRDVKLD